MTTLREYLTDSSGTFLSPAHPSPLTGAEVIQMLDRSNTPLPGEAMTTQDVLALPVQVVKHESGDEWVYVADGDLEPEGEPYLIHQP